MSGKKTKGKPSFEELSKNEKVGRIEDIIVESPPFKRIMAKIEDCHERSKYTRKPSGVLITADSGIGKTTIGQYYAKDYPSVTSEGGTIVPILWSEIPSPATIKEMASQMLYDLGDPAPDSGTIGSITRRLGKLIKKCGVEIIILDEFQNLIDQDTTHVLKTAANWLKTFMNKTKVPMVLTGMPWSVKILNANAQLKRRFSMHMVMKPFRWSTPEEQKEFTNFLIMLEKALPLREESRLYSGDMPFRLFCACLGIVDNLKKLISRAAEMAFDRGMEKITIELLALAYDEELSLTGEHNINPFIINVSTLIAPEAPQTPEPTRQRRHSGRKSAKNIASELHK
jgi:Bacterial TniB protein